MIAASRWTRIRLAACGVAFGLLFLAAGRRAFQLQVVEADHLRTLAEEQYLREIELPPRRGRIQDRNGAELASTADVDSIYCNPRRLPDARDAARRLSQALGMDRRELEKKLSQRRFFAWVKRKVTPDEVTAVKALDLPGLAFTREPRRFYPNRTLAATVMGHAGSDGASTGWSCRWTSTCAAARRRCRGCATPWGGTWPSRGWATRPAAWAATWC
jgi:cell division protein FtsI (penicillin-binding protein 3)